MPNLFDLLQEKKDKDKGNKGETRTEDNGKQVEREKICTKEWVNKSFGKSIESQKILKISKRCKFHKMQHT